MKYTYQDMVQYETRVLEITIIDQNGLAFVPDNVYYKVLDSDETEIVSETLAAQNSNTILADIGSTVTANIDIYRVVWKITKNNKVYYHVTVLEVTTL